MNAGEISRLLAQNIDALVRELLPNGHKEGPEWRCGSVAGEPGNSLGVHLAGSKAGVWSDFACGGGGDALHLIAAVHGRDLKEAWVWAHRWLGLEEGEPAPKRKQPSAAKRKSTEDDKPERWRRPWVEAKPISRTLAATYLGARGLQVFVEFGDPAGDRLRFLPRHPRKNPDGVLEYHPALIALLRDLHTGKACGIHNIYLLPEGSDRLRDRKAKTTWGRKVGAAVMFDPFHAPVYGLVIAEGIATAVSILSAQLHPVWATCGAGSIAAFPVLGGIDTMTIAADSDEPGQKAATACAERWRAAGREAAIITPAAGDWADLRKVAR
jgi:phage/plasmid primase-like uncharacterized protein